MQFKASKPRLTQDRVGDQGEQPQPNCGSHRPSGRKREPRVTEAITLPPGSLHSVFSTVTSSLGHSLTSYSTQERGR